MTFQLTVTGMDGSRAQDKCIVNVTNGNAPPIAEAGPNQTVVSGQQVTLDGSASYDAEDDRVGYLWEQLVGSRAILSDPRSPQPTFTAPEGRAEGHGLLFELTVRDGDGLRSRDTCIVNVVGANLPPKANAGQDQTVPPGTLVSLDGSRSVDPDGDLVSFRWQQLAGPPVTLSDPAGVQPSFVAPTTKAGSDPLVFQLTVTGGGNLMDKATVTVAIDEKLSGEGSR